MSIQSNVNQSLTILGALATQSPELQLIAKNRQLNKEYKNLENQSSNIRDALVAGLPGMEETVKNLDEKGFKAATDKFNINIKDLENIAEQKKNIAIKLGKSEDYSKNVDELTSLDKFRESGKENINLFEKVKKAKDLHEKNLLESYVKKAAQESNNKLSSKVDQKDRMTEMKKAVRSIKEENLRNDLYKNRDIKTGKEGN